MKSAKTWIATGFLLAASVAPAMAADWGGVKDMGGGVPIPVPAPAPVPTFDADSDWYVGLMLGGTISQSSKVTDTDTDYLGNSSPGTFGGEDVPAIGDLWIDVRPLHYAVAAMGGCRRLHSRTRGSRLGWNVALRCGELRVKSIAERRLRYELLQHRRGQIP